MSGKNARRFLRALAAEAGRGNPASGQRKEPALTIDQLTPTAVANAYTAYAFEHEFGMPEHDGPVKSRDEFIADMRELEARFSPEGEWLFNGKEPA